MIINIDIDSDFLKRRKREEAMGAISLRDIHKNFGAFPVVRGVDLEIADEEFMVFVGPSGCGKSTLLRMVAGLETISSGEMTLAGRRINDIEPRNRDIAMVFQDYALYPHMSVRENLAFGLKMRRAAPAEIDSRIAEAAEILQIGALLDRRPSELSGGQRQRVAMGRAIVRRPLVYLFDEPLSNLDAKLRVEMRLQIKRLHQLLRTTTIYVTHDQTEAMTLADRITVLKDGLIEQVGTPTELYDQPNSLFVAQFIGSPAMNVVEGVVIGSGRDISIRLDDDIELPLHAYDLRAGHRVMIGIRPEHLEQPRHGEKPNSFALTGTSELVETLGSDTFALCAIGSLRLMARLTPGRISAPGQRIDLELNLDRLHVFDAETGLHLPRQSA
ncbi:ABC transporter ATP-binding protein [Devosia honganensis]|uniref:ABC transporter ATP-binding protein n=1 Tax=Devosia honganensis TaxID=1610527 RepID=A0ABV7X5F3_9HYPH